MTKLRSSARDVVDDARVCRSSGSIHRTPACRCPVNLFAVFCLARFGRRIGDSMKRAESVGFLRERRMNLKCASGSSAWCNPMRIVWMWARILD